MRHSRTDVNIRHAFETGEQRLDLLRGYTIGKVTDAQQRRELALVQRLEHLRGLFDEPRGRWVVCIMNRG